MKKQYILIEKELSPDMRYKISKVYKPIELSEKEAEQMRKELKYRSAFPFKTANFELTDISSLEEYNHKFINVYCAKLSVYGKEEILPIIENRSSLLNYTDIDVIYNDRAKKELKRSISTINFNNLKGDSILVQHASSDDDYLKYDFVSLDLYLLNVSVDIEMDTDDFRRNLFDMTIDNFKYVLERKFKNDIDKITSKDWEYCVFYRKEA